MVLKEISDADSFDTSSSTAITDDNSAFPSNYDSTPIDDPSSFPHTTTFKFNFPPTAHSYPPLCPFSSVFGFTRTNFTGSFTHDVGQFSQAAQRPLRQGEITAVLENAYKCFAFSSYGKPLGLLYGGYRVYRGREKQTFPMQSLYTRMGTYYNHETGTFVSGNKDRGFLIFQNAAQLRRWLTVARACWWLPMCYAVGHILALTYGTTVMSVGILRDPRLREMNKDVADGVRRQKREGRRERPAVSTGQGGVMSSPAGGVTREKLDPTGQGQRPLGAIWKDREQSPVGRQQQQQQQQRQRRRRQDNNNEDDASPTAGTYDEGDDWSNFGIGSETSSPQEEQMPSSTRKAARKASRSREHSSASDAFNPSRDGSNADGESAWDRVRRESGSD